MENEKPLILSATFWGSVVALVGALVQIFKIDIAPEEIQSIATALMTLGGIIWAIYGRWTAKERISGLF